MVIILGKEEGGTGMSKENTGGKKIQRKKGKKWSKDEERAGRKGRKWEKKENVREEECEEQMRERLEWKQKSKLR